MKSQSYRTQGAKKLEPYPRILRHDGNSEIVIEITPFLRCKTKKRWLGIDWFSLSITPIYVFSSKAQEIVLSFRREVEVQEIIERLTKGFGDLR